jgi:uncharacterized membrane protein (DUF485 family)
MAIPLGDKIYDDRFLRCLMRRQLRLSIACGASFMVVLLALPLLNYLFPEEMARRVFGFTLSWLILGIAFFPFVWVIAWIFIRKSMALEEQEMREIAKASPTAN